jgi:transposase
MGLITVQASRRPARTITIAALKSSSDEQHLFKVLPKRWIVERTLAWLGRNRRLSKDYEYLPETREAFLKLAMIRLIAGRLA